MRQSADWIAAREALTNMQSLAGAAFTQYWRNPTTDNSERYDRYRAMCRVLETRLTEIEAEEKQRRVAA